jgi:hypothetical protein
VELWRLLAGAAAEGTMDEVVGGTRAVEVCTGRWEAAFTALDAAGLPVSLVGKALRVPGADRGAPAVTPCGTAGRASPPGSPGSP